MIRRSVEVSLRVIEQVVDEVVSVLWVSVDSTLVKVGEFLAVWTGMEVAAWLVPEIGESGNAE